MHSACHDAATALWAEFPVEDLLAAFLAAESSQKIRAYIVIPSAIAETLMVRSLLVVGVKTVKSDHGKPAAVRTPPSTAGRLRVRRCVQSAKGTHS